MTTEFTKLKARGGQHFLSAAVCRTRNSAESEQVHAEWRGCCEGRGGGGGSGAGGAGGAVDARPAEGSVVGNCRAEVTPGASQGADAHGPGLGHSRGPGAGDVADSQARSSAWARVRWDPPGGGRRAGSYV